MTVSLHEDKLIDTMSEEISGYSIRISNPTEFFTLDLSDFALGRPTQVCKGHHSEGFSGRKRLATQICVTIKVYYPTTSRREFRQLVTNLRHFYRFLDSCDAYMPVECLEDLSVSHTAAFKIWRDTSGLNMMVGVNVRSLLNRARECFSLEQLFWPQLQQKSLVTYNDDEMPSPDDVRKLAYALKSELRTLQRMHVAATAYAEKGSDPREICVDSLKVKSKARTAPWRSPENIAHYVRKLNTPVIAPSESWDVRYTHKDYAKQLLQSGILFEPAGKAQGRRSTRLLRLFNLSRPDIQTIFALFLIETGWNESVALALDLENWCIDHPLIPNMKVLRSFKSRGSNAWQYALSGANEAYSPYQLVKLAETMTATLRATLRDELSTINQLLGKKDFSTKLEARRMRIVECLKSPWLYFDSNSPRIIHKLAYNDDASIPRLIADVIRRNNVRRSDGKPLSIKARHMRAGFAEFTHGAFGHQWLLTRISLGHADGSTLHRYLANVRTRRHGATQVLRFQDVLFGEVRKRRVIDAAALGLIAKQGKITVEQRQRLADSRQRTRVGVGCLDPYAPPKSIAPNHIGNSLCRVQRCTLCPHAVLLPGSEDGLALRLAELFEIQRVMPLEAWFESDYPDEIITTKAALDAYDSEVTQQAVNKFRREISEGTRQVSEIEAIY